jgi:predicted metal-dependent phosphoesterase TrpH
VGLRPTGAAAGYGRRMPDADAPLDLHVHSTCSDGLESPATVVALAAGAGLGGVALADHDTCDGLAEATAAAAVHDLELVPAVELSAELVMTRGGAELAESVHVLGYWIDPEDPGLAAEMARLRDERGDRAGRIVAALAGLGVPVDAARVHALAGDAPVGRPHVARAMVEAGHVADEREAFDRFLADGGPAHVPKHALDPVAAVRLIAGAGGVAVLAHPGLFGPRDGDEEVPLAEVVRMAEAGLTGIEADHAEHRRSRAQRWRSVAGELGLVVTGGSDHHGRPGDAVGTAFTAREAVEGLRSRRPGG